MGVLRLAYWTRFGCRVSLVNFILDYCRIYFGLFLSVSALIIPFYFVFGIHVLQCCMSFASLFSVAFLLCLLFLLSSSLVAFVLPSPFWFFVIVVFTLVHILVVASSSTARPRPFRGRPVKVARREIQSWLGGVGIVKSPPHPRQNKLRPRRRNLSPGNSGKVCQKDRSCESARVWMRVGRSAEECQLATQRSSQGSLYCTGRGPD
jgi:hypothetical protein